MDLENEIIIHRDIFRVPQKQSIEKLTRELKRNVVQYDEEKK